MKQTTNVQSLTLDTQLGNYSELDVGRWTLATAERAQDGGGGLSVEPFPSPKK